MNKVKKTNRPIQVKINISGHFLIKKEEDLITAHCLELDIIGEGKTQNKAIDNLIKSIINHITFCLEYNNLDKIENPAPEEYWKKIKTLKKSKIEISVETPKLISPKKREKLPFLPDVAFEGTEVYA